MATTLSRLAAFMQRPMELVSRHHVGSSPRATKLEIRKIAVIPSAPPAELSIEDRTLAEPFMTPLSYLSIDDRRRRSMFDREVSVVRESMVAKLSKALHTELREVGFETSSTQRVMGFPDGQEALGCSPLPTREAVLHVEFTDVGMISPLWSSGYEPRLNARACLLAQPDSSEWLTSDHFYYGADSCGDTACSIPTDPNHHYPDLDALIDRAEELAEVYEVAIRAIAARISRRLSAQHGALGPSSANFR